MNYPILQCVWSSFSTMLIVYYFIKTQKFIIDTNRFIAKEKDGWVEIYRKQDEGRELLKKYIEKMKKSDTQCSCHDRECRFYQPIEENK